MALEIRIKRAEEYSARQLAAEMLADAVGSAPEDIFFYRGENGKPLTNLSLHFNCSHSGGFVVCAVGEREVGVDLEQIRPVHPRLERALTAAERQWLTSLPQAERDEGFFRLWTLKEPGRPVNGVSPDGVFAARTGDRFCTARLYLPFFACTYGLCAGNL